MIFFTTAKFASYSLFRFHYDVMKAKYGNNARLLFTDTDSLMYEVETDDFYKDMVENAELFDMSNFEQSNKYYKPEFQDNKAVVGLMKDEAAGNPIVEFCGLRPKMYSFKAAKVHADGTVDFFDKHRAKGLQRAAAAKFTHEQYLAQLVHPEENFVLNRRLGSGLHNIYGIEVLGITWFKFIISDNITIYMLFSLLYQYISLNIYVKFFNHVL